MTAENPNVNFLIKKDLGLSFYHKQEWIAYPYFASLIYDMAETGVAIGPEDVLKAMRKTYIYYSEQLIDTGSSQFHFRDAKTTMRKIERFCNAKPWSESDWLDALLPESKMFPDGFEDMTYLTEIMSGISPGIVREVCSSRSILSRIRESGGANSLCDIYNAVLDEHMMMVRYKYPSRPKRSYMFARITKVVKYLSGEIYGDKYHWTQDFGEKVDRHKNKTP